MANAGPNADGADDVLPGGTSSRSAPPRYQPLVIVLVAVAAGILADRFWPLPVFAWWGAAAAAWIGWLALWRRRAIEWGTSCVLLLSVAATAGAWHHCRWHLFPDGELGLFAREEAEPVCVEAIALGSGRTVPPPPPDPLRAIPTGARTRLDVRVVGLRDRDRWRAASGRARLIVGGDQSDVRCGDRLRVFAQLDAPQGPVNPGEFDYAARSRADRVGSRLMTSFAECVTVVEPGCSWGLRGLVDRAKGAGTRLLGRYIDPDRADLASAVLLGAREQLEPGEIEEFVRTGTVHFLAISGLHVGILAGALMLLLRRAPIRRHWAVLSVAGVAIFYMLLTDARPPVVRATILILVMCWSIHLGRKAVAFNSLAAAALVVLVVNPCDLFNTGAHLSFLAVAGLMWFAPQWFGTISRPDHLQQLIEEHYPWPRRALWAVGRALRHLTLVSALIWFLALPLVMARFNLLTPAAVVLNTLLWFPMAAALTFGFAALVFGAVAVPLGLLFGGGCDAALWLLQSAVHWTAGMPGSHFFVPGPAEWWLVGFYGSLALTAAVPRLRPPRRWAVALLAGWSAVGVLASGLRHTDEQLTCTVLSVGHGCALVVELPDGQTLLYDAGSFNAPHTAARSIARFLWSRGRTHLDAVVLSHSDVDHYNALRDLLKRVSVGVIYVSPVMFEEQNPAMAELGRAIGQSGVPLRTIRAGDRLASGEGTTIEVLHPPKRWVLGEDNANSVVLLIEYQGRRILLPGDLESPGVEAVLAEEPVDCDVLLAPHHGSLRSRSPELGEWCTPEWVVVSGGHRWRRPETESAYRALGGEVVYTADVGAVRVSLDAGGVAVRGFRTGGTQ